MEEILPFLGVVKSLCKKSERRGKGNDYERLKQIFSKKILISFSKIPHNNETGLHYYMWFRFF